MKNVCCCSYVVCSSSMGIVSNVVKKIPIWEVTDIGNRSRKSLTLITNDEEAFIKN